MKQAFFSSVATAAIALALSSSPASAYSIFFGEDTGAGGAFVVGNASAARANFLSSLVGVGTEDFEGFAGGTAANGLALNFPGSAGAITATLSDPGAGSTINSGPNGAGRFPTSGSNYLEGVQSAFAVNLSAPVAAFGFFGTDIGDFNGQITLGLSNGDNLVVPNTVNGPNGSLLFYGIIAENPGEVFTSVTFGNTAVGSDFFGFDDLTVGDLQQVRPPSGVPVPAAGLLLLSGIAGLAGLRQIRKA